jgi:ubiquinone/menaquinone biosynthesis C-methylase UbiE
MKSFLEKLFFKATIVNKKNIFKLLEKDSTANFLDMGCDDGAFTQYLAKYVGTNRMSGIEINSKSLRIAQKRCIKIYNFDLNGKSDFDDDSFDIIHANQVIEHIHNSDMFLSEIYRILKPGGYAIISTENASSWCNIFASIMGWQIFSLTNFSSKKTAIGNPWALHNNEECLLSSWNHVRIYNIRGLKEYCKAFGFRVEKLIGAGYFPLPALMGRLDKWHAHFITIKLRK